MHIFMIVEHKLGLTLEKRYLPDDIRLVKHTAMAKLTAQIHNNGKFWNSTVSR